MSAHALPRRNRVSAPHASATRSDEALRQAARGDVGAFTVVYERHHLELYRYCRSILRHDEDAHDALHNTMTKAWEALQRGDREVALRPWLFRIAHNEAVSMLRSRRSHAELGEADAVASSAEEDVELRQRLRRLRADLAVLPERQRSALVLRELCGLSHDEIAAVLVVSTATARQTIYEARVALHEAEAGRAMSCEEVKRALSDGDGRVRRGRRIRGHIRTCAGCSSFADALRRRPNELGALLPPLPGTASVGMLVRLLSGHSASGGATSAAATAASPAAIATTTIAQLASGTVAKIAVGSAIVATAGGAVQLERLRHAPATTVPATTTLPAADSGHLAGRRQAGALGAPLGVVDHSPSPAGLSALAPVPDPMPVSGARPKATAAVPVTATETVPSGRRAEGTPTERALVPVGSRAPASGTRDGAPSAPSRRASQPQAARGAVPARRPAELPGAGGSRSAPADRPQARPQSRPVAPARRPEHAGLKGPPKGPAAARPQQAGPKGPPAARPQQAGPKGPAAARPQQAGPKGPPAARPQQAGPKGPPAARPQQAGPKGPPAEGVPGRPKGPVAASPERAGPNGPPAEPAVARPERAGPKAPPAKVVPGGPQHAGPDSPPAKVVPAKPQHAGPEGPAANARAG